MRWAKYCDEYENGHLGIFIIISTFKNRYQPSSHKQKGPLI